MWYYTRVVILHNTKRNIMLDYLEKAGYLTRRKNGRPHQHKNNFEARVLIGWLANTLREYSLAIFHFMLMWRLPFLRRVYNPYIYIYGYDMIK